jgi:hypothetical protein
MKNVTISVDERILSRAREIARQQGTSLNELLRRYLESLGGRPEAEARGEELLRLMDVEGGHSGGAPFRRSDAYAGRS